MKVLAVILSVCLFTVTMGMAWGPSARAAVVNAGQSSQLSVDEAAQYTSLDQSAPDLGAMVAGEWDWEIVMFVVLGAILLGVVAWALAA